MNFLYKNILALVVAAVASALLTSMVRSYAYKQNIMDIPSQRSSHTVATPRGGGLGFVCVFLLGILFLAWRHSLNANLVIALGGGGLIIAIVGWWDDLHNLGTKTRAVIHLIAAIWALYWLGGLAALDLGFRIIYVGWAGTVLAAIGIVWMINLYNFMDGADGLAGTEGISICGLTALFLFWGRHSDLAWLCLLLAAALVGFLVWNWPPAKIFMGDVGSGFLGYAFAVLALWSEKSQALPLFIWLMLLGVFIIDSTATLYRRWRRGEELSKAHREHLYQLYIQTGISHQRVDIVLVVINMGLGLLAWLAVTYPQWLFTLAIITAICLTTIQLYLSDRLSNRIHPKSWSA